jgi:hypothetical protein
MNSKEKKILRNYKNNAERAKDDVSRIIEVYENAMELIIEKGLYAELMEKEVKKAMEAMDKTEDIFR